MTSESRNYRPEYTFNDEEVRKILAQQLHNWYYENDHICRDFRSSGWKSTLMIVNAVGHLAEAAWHHPDISASYACVTVKLMNHAANGITEKDFELAKKIEQVINWQPALEEGTLEGTPDDPKFRYIVYD